MSGPILDEDFDPSSATTTIVRPADTRPEPGLVDQVVASFRTAADEEELVQADRLGSEYVAIVKALEERGVPRERLFKTEASSPGALAAGQGFAPAQQSSIDRAAVWQAIAAERARDPQAFSELQGDRASHEQFVLRRGEGRTRDQELLSRGSGVTSVVAGLLGGGAASFADPVNVATLPVGGFGKSVAMRILSEGLVNAGIEAVQLPGTIEARRALGEDTTAGDIAARLGGAFVGGAAIRGGVEIAPRVGAKVAGAIADKVTGTTAQERELVRAFAKMVPPAQRTPEQQAALDIVQREFEIEEINPFARTYEGIDDHARRLNEALAAIEEGRIAAPPPVRAPVDLGVRVTGGQAAPAASGAIPAPRADRDTVKALIRRPESAGDDNATNALGSSASGRYQFIERTFTRLYQQEFKVNAAAAQRAWNRNRFDVAVQERLMDRLLDENTAALDGAGITADAGNLYLAHFAGAGKAIELVRADPAAPVARFFSKQAIEQNPTYLGGGKTVGQALAKIRSVVGGDSAAPLRPADLLINGDPSQPVIRPAALDAERPVVPASGGRALPMAQFRPAEIEVDAALMQFKSGGDQFGVTDRLQGVQQWDPIAAGSVIVWESADGRRLIADGHQRLGLARRVEAAGGGDVSLNAFVLREADGFTARDARIRTALKNISEGTGSAVDAAKVVREAGPEFADVIARRLPPRSALVRDGKALARLDDDAFGAVINEVIPEQFGAAIADLVPDRAQHMAMVRVLAETDPPNRLQAEAIIRQAREAGFGVETQDSLFGSTDVSFSLFAQRAKALDKTLAELRKLKGAFGVAARNAEALDSAGNRIDVAASEAALADNAQALALVQRLALRKGNAINEIINDAAARLGNGARIGGVVRDVVQRIRELDLADLERGTADAGGSRGSAGGRADAGGNGRAGEPAGQGRFDDPDALADNYRELEPAEIDAAGEAGLFGTPDPDSPLLRAFDDEAGEGARATAESDWHDIRAELARKDSFLNDPEQAGFDLDDGLGPRTAAEIEADISAERAGIDALRNCLK